MQTATVFAPFPFGSELIMTTVEAVVQRGLPEFRITGLPDRSVREAAVRVKAAIQASGLKFPLGRVVVNISPAEIPKRGTQFDLAIALAVLLAVQKESRNCLASGELGLNGELRECRLGAALCQLTSQNKIPWIGKVDQPSGQGKSIKDLRSAWEVLLYQSWTTYPSRRVLIPPRQSYLLDSIAGNTKAKRVLLIALAGRHHLLLSGPPGIGKTLLAQAAAELLPSLTDEEDGRLRILEEQAPMQSRREPYHAPYLNPHQSITLSQLIGHAPSLRPGLLSLASYGILFLDELPHIQKEVLTGLYTPMESKVLRFGQAAYAELPAEGIIIAARNLCPCGKKGSPTDQCTCMPSQITRYEQRLSAPFLDRFPLMVELDTTADGTAEVLGAEYAKQIAQAREQIMTIPLTAAGEDLLSQATEKFSLSYRAQTHLRAVSGTIAALAGSKEVEEKHLHEAMQYRVRRV